MASARPAEVAVREAIAQAIVAGHSTAAIMREYLVGYELVHEILHEMRCRRTSRRRQPTTRKKLSA